MNIKRLLFITTFSLAASLSAQSVISTPVRTFQGHEKSVYSVSFSPDGRYLATGSTDNTAKLWEATTGRVVRTFQGHDDWVRPVSFSHDGRYLATGSTDKTAKLWEIATGREVRTFRGHDFWINSVFFSPTGRYLATGSSDKTARLWETSTGRQVRTFRAHKDGVTSVPFSPDGRYLATGSGDKTAKLWEVATGRVVRTFQGHKDFVQSVSFSPDGRYLATGSGDNTAKLWEVSTGREVRTFKGHDEIVNSVSFSPDGRYLAIGSGDKTAKLWDIATGRQVRTFKGHSESVRSVSFSPDGRYLATGSFDNTAMLWEVYSNDVQRLLAERKFLPKTLNNRAGAEIAALITSKGEFETTQAYQQRLERAKGKEQRIRDRSARLLTKEYIRIDAEIAQAILDSREEITSGGAKLGDYDADEQVFPIILLGNNYKVKIPLAEAPGFKSRFGSLKITGEQQLDIQGRWEQFNLALLDPQTGARYPFGEQRDGAGSTLAGGPTRSLVPPELSIRVAFSETNGNGFLDAGEAGRIKASLVNSGNGAAIGVNLGIESRTPDPALNFVSSTYIGNIPPGKTATATIDITASMQVERQAHTIVLTPSESNGFPPDPVEIHFETYPFVPPELVLADFGVSTATGESIIRPGVSTTVQARVQNRGTGPAENAAFDIRLPANVFFTPESRKDFSFGYLKPGEFKDLEFSILTNKKVDREITITIGYTEANTQGSLPLALAIEKPLQNIQQLKVTGKELAGAAAPDVATLSVDIEKDLPVTKSKRKSALAVVFGVERYKLVSGVSFAKRDAYWAKEYFERVLGIPASRIYYRTDDDVGQAEFSKVFSPGGWLAKRIKPGQTEVYFYYAGHGSPDIKENKMYLIPYNGDPNYASLTGYELGRLYDQVAELGASSVTIFLDACFSGANRNNEMLLADARPIYVEVEGPTAKGNVSVFAAATGKQISSAWPEKKHGLFTYFMLKGLRGEADRNADREITLDELSQYITGNVSETAGLLDREQTPQLLTSDADRVLVKY